QSILDGYYVQATELLMSKEYLSAQNVVDLALELDETDIRFTDLKSEIKSGIDSSIVRLLDEAEAAEKDGRLSEAVSLYEKILLLSPEDVAVKKLMGRVGEAINLAQLISDGVEAFYLGRLTVSEGKFNDALKLSPRNIVANEYLNRIKALRQHPTDQADLEKDEKVWKIYLNALEHYRIGEYEQAIELWQEVLKYYPGNEQTLNNITQARLRLQSKE
ncbi:MAG TPA: tetratricopeptide repeat protein, partial [candidate division Zixibacteria bacterium]|nr:tetratricopeptide repeat protein [candidate division Zixibacteria bacterium]